MGLFDFWKDKGDDVIEEQEKAADDIKKHVEAADVKVDDLNVAYNDGVVDLEGSAASAEDKERAVITAGNIKGVERGQCRQAGLHRPKTPAWSTTRSSLAIVFPHWPRNIMAMPCSTTRIFEANRGIISDPDKIYPGQKIRIPKAV